MKIKKLGMLSFAVILSLLIFLPNLSFAQKEVKIGVILPLSGPLAPIGKSLKDGAELAADIVNKKYPGIGIPIAEWEGIPGLGGAKIKLVFSDSRGDPAWGAEQAKRLIEDEKVVGLLGAYQSAVTKTASVEAERAGIPFVNPDSTSPDLSKRGFKWFWRVTPHETWFTRDLFDFLDGLVAGKAPGVSAVSKSDLEPLAIAAENTEWGAASLTEIEKFAKERGWKIAEGFKYPHKATDLTSEARKLTASKAPTFLFASYVSDAILFVKAMKEMKAAPRLIWGQNAGFIAPDFWKTLGGDVNGILSRDVFAAVLGKVKPEADKINKIYKERAGFDFDGSSARDFIGVQVWAHALDKAKSTDPKALQKALNELHIPGKELIMPWQGVKFGSPFPGDTNQNELGSGIIIQYQGYPNGKPEIVFPFEMATSKLIYPFTGWK
ncbi:MAG: branched-chain amino acid ABC transporter substrate-binding protein [Deltaproteobacteria bacterium]|nr:branched-chain amino acid ABC transporter substrate-binding protein [Deltaproteobacteria bacterium]